MAKIDFSKFKKVQEEKHSTTLKHEDGHTIKLAHAGLNGKTKLQLKKLPMEHYDEGGKVELPLVDISKELAADKANEDKVKAAQSFMASVTGGNKDASLFDKAPSVGAGIDQQPAGAPETNIPLNVPQSGPAPASVGQGIAPAPSAPVDPNQLDPYGAKAQQDAYMKGLGESKSGIQQEAAALGQQSKAAGDVAQTSANSIQQIIANHSQELNKLNVERQTVSQNLAQDKINPDQYLKSMSPGQKFLTAIGLILGGGHTELLEKQMDADMRAQEQNMGRDKTLLEANLRQFGNLKDATDMTRVLQNDFAKMKFEQAFQQSNDPVIKARAMKAIGDLDMQSAPMIGQMAMRRTLMNSMSSGGQDPDRMLNAMRVIDPARAKEMEGRYVPGVGFGSVPIPDKAREEMTSRTNLQHSIADLENWAAKNTGSLDPNTVNEGKAKAALVQDAYRRANGQGVFREAEAGFVKSIIDQDPSKFFANYRTLPGYRQIAQSNMRELGGLYRSYGLKPQQVNFTPNKK